MQNAGWETGEGNQPEDLSASHLRWALGPSLFFFHTKLHRSFVFFFPFIFISWRLITLQYCSGFCHTLT